MPPGRYANRDLRNRSFRGQNLASEDFSGSDIRGCDFSGATLAGASFERVRAGQSRKQVISLITFGIFVGVVCVSHVALIIGFTTIGDFGGAFAIAGVGVVVLALAVAFALTITITVVVSITRAAVTAIAFTVAVILAIAAFLAFSGGRTIDELFFGATASIFFGLAFYSLRDLIRAIANIPGTSFRYANLAIGNFSYAVVQNSDFTSANIAQVNWSGAKIVRSNFARAELVQLLTTRNGKGKNYQNLNLTQANLVDVVLTDANLQGANLSGANLWGANLECANLKQTQALGTDFSEAFLTGACINGWGINADTTFTNVRCDYIFLEEGFKDRKPAAGYFQPGDFEKLIGQFTKTLDLLFRGGIEPQAFDFAFRELLQKHSEAGISIKSIEDVGDGDRVVRLKLENPEADPAVLQRDFEEKYQKLKNQLKTGREKLASVEQELASTKGYLKAVEEQSKFLKEFVYYQAGQLSKPSLNAPNSTFLGDPMADKGNKTRIGYVSGNVGGFVGGDGIAAGGDMMGVTGGDLSGTVTNTINQVAQSEEPEADTLADLLKQLQAAVEQEDSGLSEKDKEKALKYVDALGKLGTDQQNPDLLEKAEAALDALPTVINRGAGLIEFAEKYLPTITAGIRTTLGI